MYLNSVTLVGFVGANPELRQSRSNGSKFAVLSVATQRSWKNAEDEWVSRTEWHRVSIFQKKLVTVVAENIRKGSHLWRAYEEQRFMCSSPHNGSPAAVVC